MSHSTYTNLSVRYLPKDYYHHTVSVSHFTHQCFVSDELISREAVMKFHHVHLLRGETGLSVNFLCSLHGHVVPHQPCTNINAQPWCNTWIFQCKQRIIMAYGGSQISQENRLKVNSLSGSSKDVHTSVVNVIPIISTAAKKKSRITKLLSKTSLVPRLSMCYTESLGRRLYPHYTQVHKNVMKVYLCLAVRELWQTPHLLQQLQPLHQKLGYIEVSVQSENMSVWLA